MDTFSPSVRHVGVITAGSRSLHPEHIYGTRKPALWWVATSKERVPVPLNEFVIEHDDGLILIDTGIDSAAIGDPDHWPDRITRRFLDRVFRFDAGPSDGLADQLSGREELT